MLRGSGKLSVSRVSLRLCGRHSCRGNPGGRAWAGEPSCGYQLLPPPLRRQQMAPRPHAAVWGRWMGIQAVRGRVFVQYGCSWLWHSVPKKMLLRTSRVHSSMLSSDEGSSWKV